MKAMQFSGFKRGPVFDDACKFIGEIGGRNVREVQTGRDGCLYVLTVWYRE
jgi:hypothetical protein